MRARYLLFLPVWGFLLGTSSGWAANARFDVSYLWHSKLDSVRSYRSQVGRVLGPTVAKKLKVVKRAPLYGLIYHRQGDGPTASWLVRKHTKLLQLKGLEPAVRIVTKEWNFVPDKQGARVRAPFSRYVSEVEQVTKMSAAR